MDATAKVVANNPSLKPFVIKFTNDLLVLFRQPTITYFDIGRLAVNQTKWANGYTGAVVLALSQIYGDFDRQIPVYDCDRKFLTDHFNRQLAALGG